jgi:uncharacterized protein YutE (UPF0331/DUF86 family)
MAVKTKMKRKYILFVEKSIDIVLTAIDSFNRVYGPYRVENTLILLTNSWELLAKAVLLKKHVDIYRDKTKDITISAEEAVNILLEHKVIDSNQTDVIQQVISLRNRAMHQFIPKIPPEIQHHLFFFCCKFFKDVISKEFKTYEPKIAKNYLSISFDQLHTYSDSVRKIISRLKKSSQGDLAPKKRTLN